MAPQTVLIVEDEAISREILANIVSKQYKVLKASDGAQALELLRGNCGDIFAVLLDLMMPVMDGFETMREIRADRALRAIPVIAVTALEDRDIEKRVFSAGAFDFLEKPYKSAYILQSLQNAEALRQAELESGGSGWEEQTGLYNIHSFSRHAVQLLERHGAGYYVVSSLRMVNLGEIIAQLGEDTGAQALLHAAKTANRCASLLGGICCRGREDGFFILFPAQYMDSQTVYENHRQVMAAEGAGCELQLHIGRYLADDLTLTVEEMCRRAELAVDSVSGGESYIAQYSE